MGNPYLFKQCDYLLNKDFELPDMSTQEKGQMLLDFVKLYNKVQKIKRFSELRQHAMWFCTGADKAAKKRLALMKAQDEEKLLELIRKEFNI